MVTVAGEEDVKKRYHDLCTNLNMDKDATDQAWNSYDQIKHNYTLEGDQIHWLACALYVACRTSTIPSVGSGDSVVEGNCVSLTKLLRLSKLSLIDFFSKCKKWADMVNLPKEFRDKVDRLERSFSVSMEIFKKYEPIFMEMFLSPTPPYNRTQKSRKQKNQPCNPNRLFGFCWTLFVSVKGKFKTVGDDLVNSYHLLLACCDMLYANALLADRRDLLNPEFSGLPSNFLSEDYKPPEEAPCIINILCKKFDGVPLEAKSIKEYCLKNQIKGLFEQKVLKGELEKLAGLLDIAHFDSNYKAVNRLYEEHVLNSGDFDERIFLAEFKRRQKGRQSTPARPVLRARNVEGDEASRDIGSPASAIGHLAGDFAKKLQDKRLPFFSSQLCPATPLTGRNYLESKEKVGDKMAVSAATQSIVRLQTMVSGRGPSPSKVLLEQFKACSQDPTEKIEKIVSKLETLFCEQYSKHSQDAKQGVDFGPKRFELGKTLYYKFVETMVVKEKNRKPDCDISALLNREIVHHTLLACCLQLVLFSYNTGHTFPWILTALQLEPYYFLRIIEIVVRNEDQLCRAMVKHLNQIEEHILETMAWSSCSPLWAEIESSKQPVPSCEDVSFPGQLAANDSDGGAAQQTKTQGGVPASPVSTVDRFQTPVESSRLLSPTSAPGPARKRLFSADAADPADATPAKVAKPAQSLLQTKTATPVTFYSVKVENGQLKATTVTTNNIAAIRSPLTVAGGGEASTYTLLKTAPAATPNGAKDANPAAADPKPRRTGSLCLFFRKFYHLASIRANDLCEKLTLKETELKRKIWTCFEHIIINHIDIMKDRHLDQILMCTVYVVCKVSNNSREFLGIMKCYRGQPQADSHIYRSVLLSRSEGGDEQSQSMPKDGEKSSNPSNNVNCYAGERRGDLIKFYNDVYVKKVQSFASKLSSSTQTTENLTLSPLPMAKPSKPHPMSPRFRVSDKHQMYISTLAPQDHPASSPSSLLEYRFSRSPARDLDAINLMIQQDCVTNKKLRLENLDSDTLAKKPAATAFSRKIQGIVVDRRGQTHE